MTKDIPQDTRYFLFNHATYSINAICVYPIIEKTTNENKVDTVFVPPQELKMIAIDRGGSFGSLPPYSAMQSLTLWDSLLHAPIFNVPLDDDSWTTYGDSGWIYEYRYLAAM